MNDFKGLSRDTSWLKSPSEMWYFARNILLTSQYLSIANEKGNEYGYDIPGQVIGFAVTNEDIVYLSIDGSYTCIGYVNYLNETYVPVLRTTNPNFKFKHSCPIECVYFYNYKKELIIVFSDGINKNSSSPKLINIHNPQTSLSATKEFINDSDYVMFELFSPVKLPFVQFDYIQGSLRAEVVHLSFSYVYDDDTESMISPVIKTNYPSFKANNTERHSIFYSLNKLSTSFNRIRLYFVVKYNGAINGYCTSILNIVNNSVQYTLSALDQLEIIAPEHILIPSARFSKIKTITKSDNQLLIGNVESPVVTNYQIYANLLKLNLKIITSEYELEKYKTHPTLLPDEVYSFKIIPIYLDGSKGNALHIPGEKATSNERDILTQSEIADLGLDFPEFINKGYRRFHLINTGATYTVPMKFGYWENEQKYPNKDYYDSTSIGGEDLRNTPIRYHRIPEFGLPTKASGIVEDEKIGIHNRLYVEVANFEAVFPSSIKNLLQGYELIIEKRLLGGTYIQTSGVLYNMKAKSYTSYYNPANNHTLKIPFQYPRCFTDSFFISSETVKDNIDITATLIKCNYGIAKDRRISQLGEYDNSGVDVNGNLIPNRGIAPSLNSNRLAYIKKAEYKPANNIAAFNRFGSFNLSLTLKHKSPSKVNHWTQITYPSTAMVLNEAQAVVDGYRYIDDFVPLSTADWELNLIHASLITLNKNIYNLENGTEFISLGIIILNSINDKLIAGDVFSTNVISKLFTSEFTKVDIVPNSYDNFVAGVYSILVYNIYNILSPFSNHLLINGKGYSSANQFNTYENSGGGVLHDWYIYNYDPNVQYSPSTYLYSYLTWLTNDINTLNLFDYSTEVKSKPISDYFNSYVNALPPGLTEKTINYFPYRVHKGLQISSESLLTNNIRFFPTNSYYDMPNDRGDIVALRGFNRGVFIQQRWSLYQSTISDKIAANEAEVYLGSSELFDRLPTEVIDNSNIGYIGSNSQFACYIFRDGYVTVDEERGKIFIVNSETTEASQRNMKINFKDILPLGNHYIKKDLLDKNTKTDNPFLSVGYIVGFDEENNRLIVTKKYYKPKTATTLLPFDGEFYRDSNGNILDYDNPSHFFNESRTLSFALDSKTWVCEHDYFPNAYLYNNKGIFALVNKINSNTKFYKMNSDKVNNGNFFGVQYKSYVDLIFNTRLDISKQYQALYWVSESKNNISKQLQQFKTIDAVMMYNYHQCSGTINVSNNNLDVVRNVESKWQFNEFRDLLVSSDTKFLKEDGTFIPNAVATNKVWYEKNMFIGNFIVARLIWNNEENTTTYIHNVNIKSINSNR